ncbi:outer membrane protein assembly factor BamE [Dyella silvatica]|uniref:outer membrane protein assembly factor BamE n=1 Tax=Dyella silvatica TaxID=2992128 RepID=UPI002253AC7C|nr:outer membrane protein assembly factor BamE [Dyella silvatica]
MDIWEAGVSFDKGVEMESKSKIQSLMIAAVLLVGSADAMAQATDAIKFPNPNYAKVRQASLVDVDKLRQIKPGQNKSEVRSLLGTPNFGEESVGGRQWDYIFNIRTALDHLLVPCQYQLRFDDQGLVTAAYWNRPKCANLL